MFTVKVVERSNGRPVKSKKVSVIFNGLFRGCAKDQYTDTVGEAHFSEITAKATSILMAEAFMKGRSLDVL